MAAAKAKWRELRGLPMFELQQRAEELGIEDYKRMRKQALVYSILSSTGGEETPIYTEGVLEIIPEGGHGFLRNPDHNYLAGPDDIYISRNIIRRYDLKMGDTITGQVRQPREGEKYFALMRIDTVNFEPPEKTKRRVAFEYLTPIHPIEKLNLEWKKDEYSTRIMNLFTPIGKGQRSIILAPPRTGKTVLLQNVTQALTVNHPEVKLMVLLIDERPEEVTEMRKLIDRLKDDATRAGKNIQAEVLASTFDEPPERHIKVADMVLEKAKRLVEHGNDVVILLDSITRFARANNVVIPHSGKILSGGVDANAMQRPKRFFGAARKIENGGSLTIIGTALIETGSRMDEVIFEEFKGTGNMELVLDRRIAEKRIWPAIDIFKSGTRKEELLLSDEELRRVWVLRRYLQDMTTVEIMEFMRDKLKLFETNRDFLTSMNG
nr:transcription termination factor Rho [Fibrobacter sp. UBA3629]